MIIYTIGYTKRTAENFFETLKKYKIRKIVDLRENNTSQLSGFTKRDDLKYFLKKIVAADYVYLPVFAPTKEIRVNYQKSRDWASYKRAFLKLIKERKAVKKFDPRLLATSVVFLCSEKEATHCHRKLVAELVKEKYFLQAKIIHL